MKTIASALFFTSSLFGQTYTVSTFAGGGLPSNVPGTSAPVNSPVGVAADTSGDIYFISGNTILRLDASTKLVSVVAGNGTPGFSGDGGPATAAQLNAPNAIAVDSSGNIFIADNNRIRKVSGGIITTIAGNGTAGHAGDNGPATAAEVAPLGLAVDSSGNLYVANTVSHTAVFYTPAGPVEVGSDSIRKISGGVITTVAGNGTCCNATADNVPATSVPLYEISGIAVDSAANLYYSSVPDEDFAAAIRKISNGIVTTLVGGGPTVSNGPVYTGVAVDSGGNVYFADGFDSLIDEVSSGAVTTVAGGGRSGFAGDNGPALLAEFSYPTGVAVDPAGNLYIADQINNRIREISAGRVTTVAGDGYCCYGSDGGPATSAQLYHPGGIASDSAGNVYIADSYNSRIRKVSKGLITTVAGNGTSGFSGDGGPATAAQLNQPNAVAVDSAGNLYIADSQNRCVRKVANGIITTVAGGGPGQTYSSDGGPATSAVFATVTGVAVDASGNLYLTDALENRLWEVSSGTISTVAAASGLSYPADLGLDKAGNLYINDSGHFRILELSNGALTTVAGNGSVGYSGDSGPATLAAFTPLGLAVDSSGDLYISDGAHILRVVAGTISTIAGTDAQGYSGENVPALSAQISPWAVGVDAAGDVYFSEVEETEGSFGPAYSGRVRVLKPGTSPPGPAPSITQVVSAASFQPGIESGSWVMIQGTDLANGTRTWQASDFTGNNLPTQLDRVSVTIDGIPAYVEYISPTQINVQAPSDGATGAVNVVVTNNGVSSPPFAAQLQSAAPAFFMSPSYNVYASVIPGYLPVTANTPAMPGDLVVLWCTGFGPTIPPTAAGTIVTGAPATATLPVVTVGGMQVHVISSVLTTGTAGLYQITIELPANLPSGTVPIQAMIGGASTQSGVSLLVGNQ